MDKLSKLKDKVLGEIRKEVKIPARAALDAVQIGTIALHKLNLRLRSSLKFDLNQNFR